MWPIGVDQTAQLRPLTTTSPGDVSSPQSLPQTGHNNGQGCLAFQLLGSGDTRLIITLPFVWRVNLESRMREQKNVPTEDDCGRDPGGEALCGLQTWIKPARALLTIVTMKLVVGYVFVY